MKIEMWPIGDLHPYENNTKLHGEAQITNVAKSIEKYGWQQPIVIDENGTVIIGHCRLLAAQKLELSEVPVTVASRLTDDEIRELRIVDNKTNESAWDFAALDEELSDLDFSDFDFDFPDIAADSSGDGIARKPSTGTDFQYQEQYGVIVTCADEAEQEAVYNRLTEEGYECKVVTV